MFTLLSATMVHLSLILISCLYHFNFLCRYYPSLLFFHFVLSLIKWLHNEHLNFWLSKYISPYQTSTYSKLVLLPRSLFSYSQFHWTNSSWLRSQMWNTSCTWLLLYVPILLYSIKYNIKFIKIYIYIYMYYIWWIYN